MALNSVCEDIRQLLNDSGFGIENEDLFSFEWGSGEDGEEIGSQILVVDSVDLESPIKEDYEIPVFIIYVRGGTSEGGKTVYNRAREIYQFMIDSGNQTINGIEYVEFGPIGGVVPTGKDTNNRWRFTMNFFTYRQSLGDST